MNQDFLDKILKLRNKFLHIDHGKYNTWYRKTFLRPRRKK